MRYAYHKDGTQPDGGQIFVFGSNEAGIHGAGAAKAAHRDYGAEWGEGHGYTGRCYAIPTKDSNIQTLPLDIVAGYIEIFLQNARRFSSERYFMTRVGCGLAGYTDEEIAPLFQGAPTNIDFPEDWLKYLED